MNETLHGHDQLPAVTPAELAAQQAEVCDECTEARAELSLEVIDGLDQSPEGRLQSLCIEAEITISDAQQSELLDHPKLAMFLSKPGPIEGKRKEICLKIIREIVPQANITDQVFSEDGTLEIAVDAVADEENAEPSEMEAKQLELAQLQEQREAAETREAEVDQDLEVANTVIDDIFQNQVAVGTLAQIRAQVREGLMDNPNIEDVETAMTEAETKYIAPHEQKLTAMQAVFTSEEIQKVFGGSLAQTVSLNLRGENNAQIYADVFARIDAGFANDDDRRREVRAQVEAQLGIKPFPVDVDSGGDVNDVFKRGYGTEEYVDENGKIQERNIPLGPGFEVEYRDGHRLGVDKFGQKYASIKNDAGRFRVILPDNPTDNDIGRYIRAAQMRGQFHHMNMAQAFYPGVDDFELSGGSMVLRTPQDFVITENLQRILIGNEAVAGNDIFSEDKLGQIPYQLQFFSEKSDYVMGDVNPEQMRADLKAQGVMNKDNTINWERFETLVQANRTRYTTQKNYSQNGGAEAA